MSWTALVFLGSVWSVIIFATGRCFLKLLTSDRQFDSEEE